MASSSPGFRFSSKDAKKVLASRTVQREVDKIADRGISAFRRAARVPGGTGELAAKIRKEPMRGWDGRPGKRVVAYSPGAMSAVYGTRRSRPRPAVDAALREMNRGGRGRR